MSSKFKDPKALFPDKFLNTFGREFYKHEVLWKPTPNPNGFGIQTETHIAYRKIAQALNLSVEAVLELLEAFPAACLDLMWRCQICQFDEGCKMPDWLKPLTQHFKPLSNFTKGNKSKPARHDLVRALCESARAGLGAGARPAGLTGDEVEDESSPLLGPPAVAYFVARHRVREEQVLPAWRSVVQLCVVKLRAGVCVGDRWCMLPGALVPTAWERAVSDLALLHDRGVSQMEILTPVKLRTLMLLFQLIVAAKETYHRDERRRRDDAPDNIVSTCGERDVRDGPTDDENIHFSPDREERFEARDDESPNVAMSMIDVPNVLPETTNSDRRTGRTSGSEGLNSTSVKSLRYVEPCSSQNLLRERVVECKRKRHRRVDDVTDETTEESSENELHTELDLEPDVHVLSSDTSDCDISSKYYKTSMEASSLLGVNRVKDYGSDIIKKTDFKSSKERKSDTSAKSQNFDAGDEQTTGYWYKKSKSNLSEEQKVVWALVYTEFIKRGRSASLISLQHRWLELLHLARGTLLTVWSSNPPAGRHVHPLLLLVAHWFPGIVTENLPTWKRLVLERKIVLESDIEDVVNKYLKDDNVLLNITENLTYPELLKEYVINKNTGNATHIHKDNTYNTIHNSDKVIEQESEALNSSINNEVDVNNCISTVLDQIDPSKATVSIIFDEDSDEEAEDDNSLNKREAPSDIKNLHVRKEATSLREQNNQIPYAPHKSKELTEMTMKNIDNELEDKLNCINDPDNPRSDLLSVRSCNTELNENINSSYKLLKEKQTVSDDFRPQEEFSLLKPRKSVIDEKLVNISRVVVTPIEHLPEWKKHSRNGIIRCRSFSVKNFTKPVTVDLNQLFKCKPYINTIKKDRKEYQGDNDIKNEVRIKFEDDNFERDFDFGDDINNGIIYQKYIDLYRMPDHLRKNRIRLTKKLKLSRTYFSLNFWSLDRNIQFMKMCKPVSIKLYKGLSRVAKRVELSDINEVRRMNKSILTAQVSPNVDTAPSPAQRSSESQEEINTTRHTNNSLSSALDSSELLKLLTNYAIRTKISKSAPSPVIKDITGYSNLMDSIIDTMRLEDKNNIQNSTITPTLNSLLQTSFLNSEPSEIIESCNTNKHENIASTATFNKIQKSTEKVGNNIRLNSIHNAASNATVRQIHISANHTKELYVKYLQKINKPVFNLEKKNIPNVCELKDMILLLANNFDSTIKHEFNMKLNRRSLNLHLRKFEKQQRALVKDISKLTKILPQYVLNMNPNGRVYKNATTAKKRKQISPIKCKQSKEHCTLPGSNTDSTDNINDVGTNTKSVFDDDDCEPNLIIDERSLELSDNNGLNNLQINKINTNKITQETCNIRTKDIKEKRKRAGNKSKQSQKISEEDRPMLNEYQEWQRQKTMALKYFSIPMTDASKLTSLDKTAQQLRPTTITEQQSNGCQTNISMKRKNTEILAMTLTTSDVTKRSKLHTNESSVVCISDSSSDDDVEITGCYNAKDTESGSKHKNNSNPTPRDTHNINKTKSKNKIVLLNDTLISQTAHQNVLNTPVAAVTQPVYLIMNDTPAPTGNRSPVNTAQDTETTNNPLVFQVVSTVIPLPTLTQVLQNNTQQIPIIVMDDPSTLLSPATNTPPPTCRRTTNNQCNCVKCQSTLRPDDNLELSVNAIRNVTIPDSKNNEPSTSLIKQKSPPLKDTMTVKDYLSQTINKKLGVLIKVNGSKNLLFFCSKYLILTDVNIPCNNVAYRTTFKSNYYKFLSRVLVPSDRKGNVLLLGSKKESDYIYCKCAEGTREKCNLCHGVNINNPKNFLKIDSDYYKKICTKPIKYVRLNKNELLSNSRVALEEAPDLLLVDQKFFKKLTDSPLTYVRILSAVSDADTLRRLFHKKVVLYAFDVTQTHHDYTPLVYAEIDGQVMVDHYDDKLVTVMQRILS